MSRFIKRFQKWNLFWYISKLLFFPLVFTIVFEQVRSLFSTWYRKNYLLLYVFQIWKFWIKFVDGYFCRKFIFWGQTVILYMLCAETINFYIIGDCRCQVHVRLSMLCKLRVPKINFIFLWFWETLRSKRKVWEFLSVLRNMRSTTSL